MKGRPVLFTGPMVKAILYGHKSQTRRLRCPWEEGGHLYVRETLHEEIGHAHYSADGKIVKGPEIWAWKRSTIPAIHMPRSYSRLTLRVTDIRSEALQDITEADAYAEGVEMESADPPFWYVPDIMPHSITAVGIEEKRDRPAAACYGKLWNHINGPGAWEKNPTVAVVTFEAIQANIDTI